MRTFQQISPLRTYVRGIREEGKTVGFVPTMGALHEGHLALFRRARTDCDLVVTSIFLNPKQFGSNEDYRIYPRDLNHDLQLASNEGVDALFHPGEEEIYPSGFLTTVTVNELSTLLEGASRPGHFAGVTTVVAKLLNIVQPDMAFFGQKDYQQCLLIERMARDLNLTSAIVMVPTVRESDGLAFSSRNVRLSPEERRAAPVLYRALQRAQEMVGEGATDPETVQQEMERIVTEEPLAALDYAALVNPETLTPPSTLADVVSLAALAVRFGNTRLIDNALLAPKGVPINRHRYGNG